MNFLEKINQLEKWDNEGLISNEKHEKFNKIFKLVEVSNKSLKETKNKIEQCEKYLGMLEDKKNQEIETMSNAFKHFESTYKMLEEEIRAKEKVENTDKEEITFEEFLKDMMETFNKWQ